MKMMHPLESRIRLAFGFGMQSHPRFLEQAEVVPLAVSESSADDPFRSRFHYDLALYGVPFLFSGVIPSLSFFGRSIGDSEASRRITSYATSLLSNAFFPGRANFYL